MNRTLLASLLLVAAAACSAPALENGEGKDGLKVGSHDATSLDATYTADGETLHLTAFETSPNVVDVTYDFGESVVAFRIDYGTGEGDFMPSGEALDVSATRLTKAMLAELDKLVAADQDQWSPVERAALRQMNLLQEVPAGEILAPFHFVAVRGWTLIGSCTCKNQYIGSGYYRTVGRGCGCTGGSGNGCKGRCGPGCDATGGSSAYTYDCAKHDYGLGTFSAASDDFSFATNNCSKVTC